MTKKILKLDQASCKHILECMLEEKREEELKTAIQQADKNKLRSHLVERHEKSLMLEQKCGVKNSTGRASTSMHLQSGQTKLNADATMMENGKDT